LCNFELTLLYSGWQLAGQTSRTF